MGVFEGLKPEAVWGYFEEICQVPRPSKKEGKIIANNERLEDIFRQLSRWYDFKVVYTQPSLKDVRFYLHSNRYAEVHTILEYLQTTKGIHFTYAEKTIYVSQ